VHFCSQNRRRLNGQQEILSQRTADYQNWVEASPAIIACRSNGPEKGVRKGGKTCPAPAKDAWPGTTPTAYTSIQENGARAKIRVSVTNYATKIRIYRSRRQRSRVTHYILYLAKKTWARHGDAGGLVFPVPTTYYLNGHSFIEQERSGRRSASADGQAFWRSTTSSGRPPADKLNQTSSVQRLDYCDADPRPKLSAKEAQSRLNLSRFSRFPG